MIKIYKAIQVKTKVKIIDIILMTFLLYKLVFDFIFIKFIRNFTNTEIRKSNWVNNGEQLIKPYSSNKIRDIELKIIMFILDKYSNNRMSQKREDRFVSDYKYEMF